MVLFGHSPYKKDYFWLFFTLKTIFTSGYGSSFEIPEIRREISHLNFVCVDQIVTLETKS